MLIGVVFLKKRIFKNALIIFLSGLLFFGVTYAYLKFSINKPTDSTNKVENKVMYEKTPQNKGIIITFSHGDALLVYLDFKNRQINLVNVENYDTACTQYYGYTVDYTVKSSYTLLQEMVDRVGGVNFEYNGKTMRYTGTQVVEMFEKGYENKIKNQIISQIFLKISENSLSKQDLIYLIENCKTDMSFVDCIYWLDYIKEMSGHINFVN